MAYACQKVLQVSKRSHVLRFCRPYEKLQEFYVGEDASLLSWKLSTKKKLQCNGLHCINPGQLGSYR